MRYMGIDFGKKRVGIAISDEGGQFAFANTVLPNNPGLVDEVAKLCTEHQIGKIVMGDSRDYQGKENTIMALAHPFKEALSQKTGLEVVLEPEFLTSREAEHIQGKNSMHDASAAAIILRSYLDKIQNNA